MRIKKYRYKILLLKWGTWSLMISGCLIAYRGHWKYRSNNNGHQSKRNTFLMIETQNFLLSYEEFIMKKILTMWIVETLVAPWIFYSSSATTLSLTLQSMDVQCAFIWIFICPVIWTFTSLNWARFDRFG